MGLGDSLIGCEGIPLKGWTFEPGQDQLPSDSHNSDIAGIGIAIGFAAAAYITLFLVVLYYFLGYVGTPFENVIDHGIITFIRRHVPKRPTQSWEPFVRKAILIYSDTQLVMGLALLGSLFPQLLAHLPSYYWQIAVYLAWFSSSTHLGSITVLRRFLRDHPAIRFWRVFLMLLMAAMLAVSLLPTGDSFWMVDDQGHFIGGVPALCHFYRLGSPDDFEIGKNQGFTMLISLLILFFGYTTRILKLSAGASSFCHHWLRSKPASLLKRLLDITYFRTLSCKHTNRRIAWKASYILLEVMLVVGRAALDAWESMLWEILWLFMALLWGSIHLFLARSKNLWRIRWQTAIYEKIPHQEDDNDWTFAQVFEVIILFLPILHIFEAFFEHRREVKLGLHHNHILDDPELEIPGSPSRTSQENDIEDRPNFSSHQLQQVEHKGASPTITATRSGTATPTLIPPASHEQDYHKRVGFRLLVTLVILFSLGNMVFAIALSIIFDVELAYYGVLVCLAFAVGEVGLYAFVMVTWTHLKHWCQAHRRLTSGQAKRKINLAETAFAWVAFFLLLAACGTLMATYTPLSSGQQGS